MPETREIEQTEQSYEAPHVESVLTADELTREIQYAGTDVSLID